MYGLREVLEEQCWMGIIAARRTIGSLVNFFVKTDPTYLQPRSPKIIKTGLPTTKCPPFLGAFIYFATCFSIGRELLGKLSVRQWKVLIAKISSLVHYNLRINYFYSRYTDWAHKACEALSIIGKKIIGTEKIIKIALCWCSIRDLRKCKIGKKGPKE